VSRRPRCSLAAVGDVSFEGPWSDSPDAARFVGIRDAIAASDVLIGNLESPLTLRDGSPKFKCTLRGHPEWAKCLRAVGFGALGLANNHMMDFGPTGLIDTIRSLEDAGIRYVGAGLDYHRANAPLFLDQGGVRLAILARTSVPVSSPQEATSSSPGVAVFDEARTIAAIRHCRQHADVVVLMLHWGVEHYGYPSPSQRRLARRLIEAGLDALVGHHPHVVQGVECFDHGVVAYSLGNLVFSEFEWRMQSPDGSEELRVMQLTDDNRTGRILELSWEEGRMHRCCWRTTMMTADGVRLTDPPPRLAVRDARLRSGAYSLCWPAYALAQEWRLRLAPPTGAHSMLQRIGRLRPRHLTELMGVLRRSARIVAQRTTNPYE
jgi:poly-gamma-glutamate capsule biosynthesis protein CapA/YwtB (metallophosphatase superfamily)